MPLYRMAAAHLDAQYAQMLNEVPGDEKHRIHLTCPAVD